MDLTLLIWNSIVASLAVAVVCYLASFQKTILLALVLALSLFASFQFALSSYHDPMQTMGFIKLMLLLPLGLGSLLAFFHLAEARQQRSLTGFTRYINMAVAANIFVMVFTPDGDSYRGLMSRFVCLTLLLWLLQEMAKQRFQTTQFDGGFFIFRSSPLNWVFCHACYRLALLSLPAFDSLQYLLLEPLSLLTMSALYRLQKKRYPLHYYFGFADTLVVTTLAVMARYPLAAPFALDGPQLASLSQTHLDILFVPMQIAVIGFAWRAILCNALAWLNSSERTLADKSGDLPPPKGGWLPKKNS